MNLVILSVEHDRQGLPEVQRISQHADRLAACVEVVPGVEGVLSLVTCNRVELLIDAPEVPESHLRLRLARELTAQPRWTVYQDGEALEHLFRVACGLASMVVGEREIAGQLRRALQTATETGRASGPLIQVVNAALRTARRVGAQTSLHDSGRSVASVGLDQTGIGDWSGQRVLLVGTGSFAGAVVATLRARGVTQIVVHSASGKGEGFAVRHQLPLAADLAQGLRDSTLVVTCRGSQQPVIRPEHLAQTPVRVLLDLSLSPDVDPAVAELPGITLLDLAAVRAAIRPTWAADTAQAERLVREGIAEASGRLASRAVDPAVASLRQAVLALVDEEVRRLPQGRPLTTDDCAQALRRLANRFLHTPSARAREAALEGRVDDYLAALEEVYGPCPGQPRNEDRRCPVTGLSLADLRPQAVEHP